MRSSTLRNSGLVAAAASALVAIGIPMALAAPTATPPSDAEGYVDSTARCTKPDTAVLFGTTQSSRVAICKTADGSFEYRGVRVRDGAKLVAPATQTSGTSFAVDSDGVKYTVTPIALSVTANGDTFRTETWTDFHGPRATGRTAPSGTGPSGTGPSGTGPSGTGPSGTGPSGTGQPGSSAAAGSGAAPSKSATTPGLASPTLPAPQPPAAPPLPPLAAEVGGGSSAGE